MVGPSCRPSRSAHQPQNSIGMNVIAPDFPSVLELFKRPILRHYFHFCLYPFTFIRPLSLTFFLSFIFVPSSTFVLTSQTIHFGTAHFLTHHPSFKILYPHSPHLFSRLSVPATPSVYLIATFVSVLCNLYHTLIITRLHNMIAGCFVYSSNAQNCFNHTAHLLPHNCQTTDQFHYRCRNKYL